MQSSFAARLLVRLAGRPCGSASLPSELSRHRNQAVQAVADCENPQQRAEVRAAWRAELSDALVASGQYGCLAQIARAAWAFCYGRWL